MTAGDDNFLEAVQGSLPVVLLPRLPVDFTHMYDLLSLRFFLYKVYLVLGRQDKMLPFCLPLLCQLQGWG